MPELDVWSNYASAALAWMSLSSMSPLSKALILLVIYKVLDRLVRLPRLGKNAKRYILVTGASKGFGYDTVKRLDALGCHVFAGVRTQEAADMIRATCSSRVEPVIVDIAKPETIQSAFKFVSSKLPRDTGLWGLVNNAAIGWVHHMEWLQINDYEEFLQTNVIGVVRMTTTFMPLIKKARGRVVNVSSIVGRLASPAMTPYSMSKYAIEAYSDCLRRCMIKYGVKVLLVEPGSFNTGMVTELEARARDQWAQAPQQVKDELGEKSIDQVLSTIKIINVFASNRIGEVSEAYIHALLARYPRARYMVGPDAAYFWWLVTLLPEWASDLLVTLVGFKE